MKQSKKQVINKRASNERNAHNRKLDTPIRQVNNLNILVIAWGFPPKMGGGTTRAYNVVKGLTALGHNVTVITSPSPHQLTKGVLKGCKYKLLRVKRGERLNVIRIGAPLPAPSASFVRKFLSFILFNMMSLFVFPLVKDVDVIWSANLYVFAFFPSLFYGIIKGCPIAQNVDDLWPEVMEDSLKNKFPYLLKLAEFVSKISYIMSAALTPISPGYVDVIVNKYRITPLKIYVVPGGVDLEVFTMQKNNTRRKDTDNEFNILYIGSLYSAYDFDQVLEAANLLSANTRVKFIIQGSGELGSKLKLKVGKMKLSNVIVILKVVSRHQVAEVMSKADVLLLPLSGSKYIETGISSKLYEYQASGKPIICCSKGESAQYISKTRSGIVVNPGDYKGLAKAILYLYNNRDIAQAMGNAGRRYVRNNLSCEKIGLKMEAIFKSVLAR